MIILNRTKHIELWEWVTEPPTPKCPYCGSEPALYSGSYARYECPKCGLRTPKMNQEGTTKEAREYLALLFWNSLISGVLGRLLSTKVHNPKLYSTLLGPTTPEHGIAWAIGRLHSGYGVRRRCWPDHWHVLAAHPNDYRLIKSPIADILLTKDWGTKYSWLPKKEDIEAQDWELFPNAKEEGDY